MCVHQLNPQTSIGNLCASRTPTSTQSILMCFTTCQKTAWFTTCSTMCDSSLRLLLTFFKFSQGHTRSHRVRMVQSRSNMAWDDVNKSLSWREDVMAVNKSLSWREGVNNGGLEVVIEFSVQFSPGLLWNVSQPLLPLLPSPSFSSPPPLPFSPTSFRPSPPLWFYRIITTW